MKKLVAVLLVALISISACFCLSSCDKEEMTYWNIVKRENPEGLPLEYYAAYKLQRTNTIKEVWINIGSLSDSEVAFNITYATSETANSAKEDSAIVKPSQLSKNNGWVRLVQDKNYSYYIMEISTSNAMHINEIVVVDSTDKLITLTLLYSGVRPDKDSQSKEQVTAAELTEKKAVFSALNTIDEQGKFKLSDMVIDSSAESSSQVSGASSAN